MINYSFILGTALLFQFITPTNVTASPPPPISEYFGNWRIISGHSNSSDCKGYPSISNEASKHIGKTLSFGLCQNSPAIMLDSQNCDVNSWLYNIIVAPDSEHCTSTECRKKELMLFYNGFTFDDRTYLTTHPTYGYTTNSLLGFAYASDIHGYEVVISKAITEKKGDCWINTTTLFNVVKIP